MVILVKLYGDLSEKHKIRDNIPGIPKSLNLESNRVKTVFDIIEHLNILEDDISHVFVNGLYCGLGKSVNDGDRVGLFPKRMAILFAEIPKMKTIHADLNINSSSGNFDPIKAVVDIPEGSIIKSVLLRYKTVLGEESQKVLVNGKLIYNENHIIKIGDTIEISST